MNVNYYIFIFNNLEFILFDLYFRTILIYININKDRLFLIYRILVSDIIERRIRNMQRHREEYIILEPNFVWLLNEYIKLASYEIEVYVLIDVYLRYII